MKYFLAFISFAFFTTLLDAQSPQWLWAHGEGGTQSETGNACAKDAAGNLYIAGNFASPSFTLGSTVLSTAGSDDIFLVKYSPSGNVIWVRTAGGAGYDNCLALAVDSSCNVCIVGGFTSPNFSIGSYNLVSSGLSDFFVAKYDSTGNLLWAKRGGGNALDEATSVCSDRDGNFIVTGYNYSVQFSFDTTSLPTYQTGIVVLKINPSGNPLWLLGQGNSGHFERGRAVTCDTAGNIFVAGHFRSDTITLGTDTFVPAGLTDVFLEKLTPGGQVLWAISGNGSSGDMPYAVSTDLQGNVFLSADFASPVFTIGDTTFNNHDIFLGLTSDIVIAKFDASGNMIWARSWGGSNQDFPLTMQVSSAGDVYFGGYFSSDTLAFDSDTLFNGQTLSNDIFLCRLDSAGNPLWAVAAAGTHSQQLKSLSICGNDELFLTGSYNSLLWVLGNDSLINNSPASENFIAARIKNSPVGIPSLLNEEKSISLFPNPSGGLVNLHVQDLVNREPLKARIYNIFGQMIFSSVFSSENSVLNLSAFSNGIYFVLIEQNGKIIGSEKLVVQN